MIVDFFNSGRSSRFRQGTVLRVYVKTIRPTFIYKILNLFMACSVIDNLLRATMIFCFQVSTKYSECINNRQKGREKVLLMNLFKLQTEYW